MLQISDGDSYYEDLLQHVLYMRYRSRQYLLSYADTQLHLDTISPPIPTDFIIYFGGKNNLPLKLIYDAINIYDRFIYSSHRKINDRFNQYQSEIISEAFTDHIVLDMILCTALAISFDSSNYCYEIPCSQISAICQRIGHTYSQQFIRQREWFIFETIGHNVLFPSILDLTYHIYLMLSYKFQEMIELENLEDILLSYTGVYYKYRKNIFDIIKREIEKQSSAQLKTYLWFHANGDIPFAAAVVILSSLAQVTIIQFKDLPEELFTILEEWLAVTLDDLIPIILFMWGKCHPRCKI